MPPVRAAKRELFSGQGCSHVTGQGPVGTRVLHGPAEAGDRRGAQVQGLGYSRGSLGGVGGQTHGGHLTPLLCRFSDRAWLRSFPEDSLSRRKRKF